ncbi:unnamed protein product [Arabidopsis lyrata]|uniref:DNA polymerase II subunit 2 n=1 Tax=Arabidopsis lyrata subsp. lyrata TaxID=81972 RepID=D7LDM9_ARALL|nr:hypothetical protein ARALYDRAFT_902197 [Arabidopsis lyrata subsp. lyrata]CAH8264392.1 unnamed protein product [Arabidopsis lyrata]
MGLISQLEDGHFYLEYLSACVKIDLSKAICLFGTSTIDNLELYRDSQKIVIACGFPHLEDRDKTLSIHSENYFFGSGRPTKDEMIRLADLERKAVNDTFVIWLEGEESITVLDGFESVEIVPTLCVFMGNFCSRPSRVAMRKHASLYPTRPLTVLPRCGLPEYSTEELREVIPNAIFSSNPCRRLCSSDKTLWYRMIRSRLLKPSSEETNDPFEHLVSKLIHQSHLCPLPLLFQPIIWNYDHCLRLYPTPYTFGNAKPALKQERIVVDLLILFGIHIVLGDKSDKKVCKFGGATCFNPGSFSTDSTFVAYRPSTQEIELSPL